MDRNPHTYPGGTVLAVGRNYRSTPQIVTTAARLIAHNRARAADGLTVRVLTGRPLAERAAVRDCLAVCRVLVNPADWPAWDRILRGLRCGIGAKTLATLRARAAAVGVAAALTDVAGTER